MKKLILILSLTLPSLASAQVVWNQSTIAPFHLSIGKPIFDASGNLTNMAVTVTNGATCTSPSYAGQTITFNMLPKTFDMVALGATNVTADGVTVTYKQLADLIVATMLQQNPLPVVTNNVSTATISTPTISITTNNSQ